jgi:transposase-like protein
MSGQSSRQYKGEAREAYWRERIAAYAASGLSLEAFCRREGNSSSAMRLWQRRLYGGEEVDLGAQTPAIVPVAQEVVTAALALPDAARTASPLRVHVGGRFQIDIAGDFVAPVLVKLLRTLEQLT